VTRTGINPTQAQIGEIAGSDVTGEIVMLNLLRFSDAPQEYGRYEEIASRHLAKAGARITWIGAARQALEHRERGLAGTVLICCTELPLDQEQRAGAGAV
jgi:hypothetical protein